MPSIKPLLKLLMLKIVRVPPGATSIGSHVCKGHEAVWAGNSLLTKLGWRRRNKSAGPKNSTGRFVTVLIHPREHVVVSIASWYVQSLKNAERVLSKPATCAYHGGDSPRHKAWCHQSLRPLTSIGPGVQTSLRGSFRPVLASTWCRFAFKVAHT